MRIVSLVCSNTEIVHALGMTSHLVGVDDHSDHPLEVLRELPRLGPELDIHVGTVADLKPDLVLASLSVPGHEKVVAALERLQLPLMVLDPVSLPDVFSDIRRVAQALEVSQRGESVVQGMEEEFGKIREAARIQSREPPSILVEWWPEPVISPGRLSWVHDLLGLVGARNPLESEEVRSRPISHQEVVSMAPDAFVLSWCGIHPSNYRPDVIAGNPNWQRLDAVREGRIYCVPEAYLGRPGPRLVEGARALRRIVEGMGQAPA